ncbi:hypothetical protein OKIT_0950 [Oenococcus kitaharae DSM 17330]|uniref:Uncharacterized protein n=2 Tax=Oenococcus kitaharae TaxID=336988 RepID=G9WJK9_9LACO|nr:hypothetical protein OKIT_0950 [Oenococcus kitaharae DSM 17330]
MQGSIGRRNSWQENANSQQKVMKAAITKTYDNSDQALNEYSLENANGTRISVNGLTASLDEYTFSPSTNRLVFFDQVVFDAHLKAHQRNAEVTVHENSLTFAFLPQLQQKISEPVKQISYSLFEDDSLSAKFNNGQSADQNLDVVRDHLSQFRLQAEGYQAIKLSGSSVNQILAQSAKSKMWPWLDRTRFLDWQSFFGQPDRDQVPALLFTLAARDERKQAALVFRNQTKTQRLEIYSNAQRLMFQKKSYASHSFLTLNFFLAFSQKQSALPSNRDLWINYKIYT